ncbi:nicotinate-nucleotide adenylyltransferase [Legionella sp. km772]|uniref:nicotinate-nucleotide adenylyltransferase n=1 Tax=Legionella sp. km772 TaxID=2498111 RepID=UPI000F8E85EA|nr:nicotinate-nucleotide adenylyltransferase [Legionella sp. km772]RUR09593.1 nicotinate-nucleotide adenylyltransferase [Legionella sp. km772]
MHSIAIFGGTFDPIHNGHILTSLAIQKSFQFSSYRFIPCKVPAIKPASTASTEQRIHMLRLALKNYNQFEIDLREIKRDTPSYMVETLKSLRKDYPYASITLILGFDAFLSLPKWYQWEKIIELANILVINREAALAEPSSTINNELLKKHQVNDKKFPLYQPAGVIYQFNAGNYPISSTEIRAALKKKCIVDKQLPEEVANYIKQQKLYS